MATNFGVIVLGVNELNARLRAAGNTSAAQVRNVLSTGAQLIISEVIPEMESQFLGTGHAPLDGQLEMSLRKTASASKRGASVSIIEGRAGANNQTSGYYAGVWEFGGYPGGYPFKKEGRALLPVVKKNRDRLVALVEAAMQELAKQIEG